MKVNVIIDVEEMDSPKNGDVIAYDENRKAWKAVPKEHFLREIHEKEKEIDSRLSEAVEMFSKDISALNKHVNVLAKAIGGSEK